MIRFQDIQVATRTKSGLVARYAALDRMLDAGDHERRVACVGLDAAGVRHLERSGASAFRADTTDASAKAAREYADSLGPEAATWRRRFKTAIACVEG